MESPYGVWVGGVAVTAANKDNVLKGTANDGSVVFTPADATAGTTATLTLSENGEVSIKGVAGLYHGAAIMSNHDLTIDIEDSTTLTGASCTTGAVAGIYVDGALTLKGTYGSSLTVTAGNSTDGTIAGEDFSAGIYAGGDIGIYECTATGGSGTTFSYGVFTRGALTMTDGNKSLTGNGGAGSAASIGICALGGMNVTKDEKIVAKGADVAGGSSVGLYVLSLSLGDDDIQTSPTIEAYGGAAKSSHGILKDAAGSSAATGITLVGRSSITAQGGDATLESYGIRCANATDAVSVSSNSHIKATAGSASAADGTSEGIAGCLAYTVNDDKDVDRADLGPIVDASSGAAKTSKALSADPQISGDYRWLTDEVSSWQHGTANPFQYSGSEQSVSLRSARFLVWVGKTQVTMANKDNVLGDGKVSFVPATDDSSLGTLSLDNATIDDSSSSFVPAIEAHGSLTINLAGDSKAVGGDGNDYAIGVYTRTSISYDDTGDALTVIGDGTLYVTSLPSDDNKGAATLKIGEYGRSPLTISGAAKIVAEAPSGTVNSHGVEAGDITLTGAASLIGKGGPAVNSAGIYSYGAISLSGTSKLTGTGDDSTKTVKRGLPGASYGVKMGDSITVADEATLVAHSGAVFYGSSIGISGGGTFAVTGGTLDIQSGVADKKQASTVAPDLSGYASYQWKTTEADPWISSASVAYAYDSAQTCIQVAALDYNVWAGGVRVNSANKDNVLKGTANDGKVSYDPDTKTLSLSGANFTGADGVNDGAGIYTTLDGLTVNVTGDNTVTGAAGSDTAGMSCGIEAPNFTITGTGSLKATAADMAAGSDTKSYGVLGNVKLEDGVHAVFAAGKAAASSATSAALDLSGHSAYHWRTSSTGTWTNSTTAPYAFVASDAYVEIAAGTVSVPTAYTASTSSGSHAAALADTGDGSLTLPLVLLVSALVAMGALVACRLRSASE